VQSELFFLSPKKTKNVGLGHKQLALFPDPESCLHLPYQILVQ